MSDAEYKEHRKQANKRQKINREKRLSNMTHEELEAHKAKINRDNQERRDEVRRKVYSHYGSACACCGETEICFLSIDHMDNDGAEHRRANNLQTGEQFYRWIVRNDYPKNLQILCMNCNWGKRMNNGVCPHVGKV